MLAVAGAFFAGGSKLSLPGSWNVTVFFTAVLAAVPALDAVPALLRVVFFGCSSSESDSGSAAFLGRPRAALAGAFSSVAGFFAARPRGPLAGASVSGSAAFLGRPLPLVWATSSSSSSSFSSARVFLFADALLVLAVAVDVALALAAAVTILVVLTLGSAALAAARARVIRLGGDSMAAYVFAVRVFVVSREKEDDKKAVSHRIALSVD